MENTLQTLFAAFGPLFIAIAIGAVLEWLVPWRDMTSNRLRWIHAAVLTSIGFLTVAVLFPLGQAGMAYVAGESGFGLFNWIGLPFWAALILGFLILDLAEYLAHWSMHNSPLLWRLHRLHHSDAEMDISTGFRFHPVETLYRFLIGLALVAAFGVPVLAIPIYAIVANGFNVWEHANVTMPRSLRGLSRVLITPTLHRIHHSDQSAHYGSNLGIVFTAWDKMFGTYLNDPDLEPRFGLGDEKHSKFATLGQLISDPLRRSP